MFRFTTREVLWLTVVVGFAFRAAFTIEKYLVAVGVWRWFQIRTLPRPESRGRNQRARVCWRVPAWRLSRLPPAIQSRDQWSRCTLRL